jgi:chromosome segregation ATPase
MTDQPIPPVVANEPVVTPPAPVPAAQPEDYEKRFKGLQKLFDKQHSELENLQNEHTTSLEGREAILQAQKQAQTQLDQTKVQLTALQTEKETLAAQVKIHETQALRSKLILSDYVDLAAFEARGLLPQASTEEEMKSKFTAFREALGATVSLTVTQKLQGASPAVTGVTIPNPARSKEQVYAELNRLAGSRKPEDRAKRDELVAEWDALNKQTT